MRNYYIASFILAIVFFILVDYLGRPSSDASTPTNFFCVVRFSNGKLAGFKMKVSTLSEYNDAVRSVRKTDPNAQVICRVIDE